MKAPKVNQAEDKILDEYLKGKSHLSDSYKQIALDLPGVEIDNSILAASRREVNARPKPVGAEGWRKWQVPFSIAALLVISASLTLTMTDYQKKADEIPIESAPIVVKEETKPTRGDSFGDKLAGADADNKASGAATTSPVRKLEPVERAKAKMAQAETPPAKAAEPKLAQDDKQPLTQPASNKIETSAQAFPSVEQKDSVTDEKQAAVKMAQPEQIKMAPAESRAPTTQQAEVTIAAGTLSAGAAASVADKAMPTVVASAPTPAASVAAPAPVAAADYATSSRSKSARMAAAAPEPLRKPSQANEADAAATYSAAQPWLAKIEALLREGKTEEAEKTLAEFKLSFPNYATPDSIKEELAKQRAAKGEQEK